MTAILQTMLLNALWQIPLLAMAGLVAERLLRPFSPAAHYRLWLTVVALELLIPTASAPPRLLASIHRRPLRKPAIRSSRTDHRPHGPRHCHHPVPPPAGSGRSRSRRLRCPHRLLHRAPSLALGPIEQASPRRRAHPSNAAAPGHLVRLRSPLPNARHSRLRPRNFRPHHHRTALQAPHLA